MKCVTLETWQLLRTKRASGNYSAVSLNADDRRTALNTVRTKITRKGARAAWIFRAVL